MTREDYLRRLWDTYRLVRVLADKNGCRTLHIRHRRLERDAVLHVLASPCAAYEVLCGIRCDNLPEIYDAISLEDGQAVLEEYVEGMTVAQVMETGRYRYRGAKQVLTGVCHGLAVLHRYGIIHRDVKPENVLVGKGGRVVLIDFNASRQGKGQDPDTVILGTVGYASPEQLGLAPSDARTDIYAAGVLFNVLLTGVHPSVRLADGRAGRIVKKCTGISPDDRYPTAEKLADAL